MLSLLLQIISFVGFVLFMVLFTLMLGVFVKHYSFLSGVLFVNALGALALCGMRLSWKYFLWWFLAFTGLYVAAIAIQWFFMTSGKLTLSGYVLDKVKQRYHPFVIYMWLLGSVFYLPPVLLQDGLTLQQLVADIVKHGRGTVFEIEDRKVDVCILIK